MFTANHWLEVFQALRRNRLRTILTACGVFWGVFMLIAMLGFSRGLENGSRAGFSGWAANSVFIWPRTTSKPYRGRQPGRQIRLTLEDLAAVQSRVAGIELVAPRNDMGGRFNANVVTHKDRSESFQVTGVVPEHPRLESLEMHAGRFFNPVDQSEHRKVAVIGTRVRDALFAKGEDPIGGTVRVGNVPFTVVGVFGSRKAGSWDPSARVFIPRETFARAFGSGPTIDYFALLVSPHRSSIEVEQEVRTLLFARHGVHPDDARAIGGFNLEKEYRKVNGLFLGIAVLTWVVGILTLLAGAIGVSNIMMVAVAERTREIGIRKAIGAPPFSIVAQIVTEATVLTAVAGYLGLVVGVGVLELVARIVDHMPSEGLVIRPEIDLGKALLAALVLTIAGGLAGLAPARSAVAIHPVEALAHE